MSSNAPHSSMRRYVIAAAAALGCLLPAACDVAAASPGSHHNDTGQSQQGGGRHNGGGPRRPAPSAGASGTAAAAAGRRSGRRRPRRRPERRQRPGSQPHGRPGRPRRERNRRSVRDRRGDGRARERHREQQRPRRAGPRLLARASCPPHDGFQKAPACVSTAFGEVRPSRQGPVAAHHRLPAAVVRAEHRVHAQGQHQQPGARPVPRRGGRRLLPRELRAQRQGHPARALPHRVPDAVQPERPRPTPPRCPPSSWRRRTTAAAPPRTRCRSTSPVCRRRGIAQCTVWAGDGSHRIPMMERANQTPAFDSVRILVG